MDSAKCVIFRPSGLVLPLKHSELQSLDTEQPPVKFSFILFAELLNYVFTVALSSWAWVPTSTVYRNKLIQLTQTTYHKVKWCGISYTKLYKWIPLWCRCSFIICKKSSSHKRCLHSAAEGFSLCSFFFFPPKFFFICSFCTVVSVKSET